MAAPPTYPVAVAPMMEWTDRHCRYFLRQLTRHALLHTEMITAAAVRHGDRRRLLAFHPAEHPVAVQLGGSEPDELAEAARIAADFGYDEVNLNVGCPSDRVQSGRFGACLMAEPDRVARCVAAMQRAVSVPVSVKHRLGIDDQDEWTAMSGFVRCLADAGCRRFVVHARKAWLQGLSPKQNREVPPLHHALVHRLKAENPELSITINGGITSLAAIDEQLRHVDGVMLGRAAYQNPYLLAQVDRRWYGAIEQPPSRHAVVAAMLPYLEAEAAAGTPLRAITRHMLGLFNDVSGARKWRRALSDGAVAQPCDVVHAAAWTGEPRRAAETLGKSGVQASGIPL
jgi:tRNA-dihydrouridine synthase A